MQCAIAIVPSLMVVLLNVISMLWSTSSNRVLHWLWRAGCVIIRPRAQAAAATAPARMQAEHADAQAAAGSQQAAAIAASEEASWQQLLMQA